MWKSTAEELMDALRPFVDVADRMTGKELMKDWPIISCEGKSITGKDLYRAQTVYHRSKKKHPDGFTNCVRCNRICSYAYLVDGFCETCYVKAEKEGTLDKPHY